MGVISNNKITKVGQKNSQSIPPFSDIFKKQKKVVQFKDIPPQKIGMTNDVVDDSAIPYTSDDRLNSQSADRRNKIKLKKMKKLRGLMWIHRIQLKFLLIIS